MSPIPPAADAAPSSPSIDPFIFLRERVVAAARAALGADAGDDVDPALHLSQHADYQADLALALGRKLKRNPREVAAGWRRRWLPTRSSARSRSPVPVS